MFFKQIFGSASVVFIYLTCVGASQSVWCTQEENKTKASERQADIQSADNRQPATESGDDDFQDFMKANLRIEKTPRGLPKIDPTGDDTQAMERINLGRRLFFDKNLSADQSTSCATCHQPQLGFSNAEAKPTGVAGKIGRRNPPTLVNRAYGKINFWDGRVETLEDQALEPIENPLEFGNTIENVLELLRQDENYVTAFANAFDDGITRRNLAAAIASFERTLLSGDSRIDRFVTAEGLTLTKSERQGLWIYESKGGCWKCHTGKTYTDESFHNTGVSWGVEPLDLGRYEFSKSDEHKGQFKTPTLRDVALTAPYMHDGSIRTLEEVIEFYDRGGTPNPHLDHRIKPLELSAKEKGDLVAFLKALTGRHSWDPPENSN